MPHQMKATEPDGAMQPRIDDDDVEGHGGKSRAADDDTEGHGGKSRAADDDTEGHGGKSRAADDDTEGHMMGNPLLNQQLARAREQEIQRNVREQQVRSEASRPHKK